MPKKQKHKRKNKKILAVLMGPPGSGKTTYAKNTLYNYYRISQDDFGRTAHYKAFLKALLDDKQYITIDRMGLNKYQRLKYILPAKYLKYKIVFYWFQIPKETCLKRLKNKDRKDHPTLKNTDVEKHQEVLKFFFDNFEPPDDEEAHEINIISNGSEY